MNRYILLASVIISLLLPFLHFENLFIVSRQQTIPSFFIDFSEDISRMTAFSSKGSELGDIRMNWPVFVFIIYLSGIVVLGARLIFQASRIIRIRKKHKLWRKDGMNLIYIIDEIAPCSFFNLIFINRSVHTNEEIEKIITHERAHIKNLHFFDLFLVGLAGILQWFNPVVWFYERSIREIHEYEADREVLKLNPDTGRYQALLVNQMTGIEIFRLANSFSKSLTKKRMIMMTKIKSTKLSTLKVLFVLPIILCLVFAFSKPQIIGEFSQGLQPVQVSGKVLDAKSGEPLSGAAVIIEGTTEGTITDESGKYIIEISGNEQLLVFSFVGYETIHIKADRQEINVNMKRKVYEIPEGKSTRITDERSEQTDEELFFLVEEMPSFQGRTAEAFREYLQDNLIYPEEAKESHITGRVYVQMIVNSKGEVTNVEVVRSASPVLNAEAIRVVESSPLWKPGSQRGIPVAVQFTVPIDFNLPEM